MLRELRSLETAFAQLRAHASSGGLDGMSADELASAMTAAQAIQRTAHAFVLDATAVADRSQVARSQGATSTGSWLAQASGISHRDAARDVQLARDLQTNAPRTRDALDRPGMSTDKARVISGALRKLPRDVTAAERDRVEVDLVDKAQRHSLEDLRRAAKRAVEVVDVPRADQLEAETLAQEERRSRRERSFWMSRPDDAGMVEGGFVLDALTGDILRSALDSFTSPRRRNCDDSARERPDEADRSDTAPTPSDFTRDYPHRLGEAFSEVLRHLPTDGFGDHGGVAATLVVTVDERVLRGELERAGTTTHRTRVSPGELRILACAAGLLPAVLNGDGTVLDVGRKKRFFTPAQRLALAQRDGGCAFPGCDRPPGWTEAHHTKPWALGGSTDLSEGVLLCGRHHRDVHHHGWEIRIARDGRPEFIPPTRIDPERRPRRNDRWEPRPRPAQTATTEAAA